jgi:hypothetical protein
MQTRNIHMYLASVLTDMRGLGYNWLYTGLYLGICYRYIVCNQLDG